MLFTPNFPHVQSYLNRCFGGVNKNHDCEKMSWKILWCMKKAIYNRQNSILFFFKLNSNANKLFSKRDRSWFVYLFFAPLLRNRKFSKWISFLYRGYALNWLAGVNKSEVATFCCFSQLSALSTEIFNRCASSWQREFFTNDVDRQYELNGIGRVLPGKCAHAKKSNFPYFPYPKMLEINLPNSNVSCSDVTYCNVIHQSHLRRQQ